MHETEEELEDGLEILVRENTISLWHCGIKSQQLATDMSASMYKVEEGREGNRKIPNRYKRIQGTINAK